MIGIAAALRRLEREREVAKLLDLDFAKKLRRAVEATQTARWESARGGLSMRTMSNSHVFFALAKGLRGEYSDGRSMHALEAEAIRRLLERFRP